MEFAVQDLSTWSEFTDFVRSLSGEWAFRGQTSDWSLRTSLERVLNNWEVDLAEGPDIERQIIRDFRRRYSGEAENLVNSDTIYCLALMQHYGAPTRLIDWTYSPFVAAKFALETGAKDGVVWCMNTAWCQEAAVEIAGIDTISARNVDQSRGDVSFLPLYMGEVDERRKFVMTENPLRLNDRLIIQQGIFLCPGDISTSFVENLQAMRGWNSRDNLIKIRFKLKLSEVVQFVVNLQCMNVDSRVLFPGLDGFARSLGERLPLYVDLARRKIGTENFKTRTDI